MSEEILIRNLYGIKKWYMSTKKRQLYFEAWSPVLVCGYDGLHLTIRISLDKGMIYEYIDGEWKIQRIFT